MKLSDFIVRDAALKQLFQRSEQKYNQAYQQAFYTYPNENQKSSFVNAGMDSEGDPIFIILGLYQDTQSERQQRLYMILISWFQKQFDNFRKKYPRNQHLKFTIIYFNTLCGSSAYSLFKDVYKTLPLRYFDNLKKIIVVDAGFTNKAFGWMASGTINNYLHSLTFYIDETVELRTHGITVDKQFRSLIPKEILSQERRKAQGMCFQREIESEDEVVQSKVKLIPPYLISNKRTNNFFQSRLDQYDLTQNKIPIVLKLLVNRFESHPQMLEYPGIFRKCVSVDDQKQAADHLSYKDYDFINKIDDPYLIASLIVKIFSLLHEPIIPYPTYHKLVNSIKQDDMDFKLIQNSLYDIPPINQNNLFYLLNFMRTQVVVRQKINKMTSYNIAAVLMPALMRSQNPITDLVHAKKCVKIVQFMIDHCHQLGSSKIVERPFQSMSSISKGGDTRHTINLAPSYDRNSGRNTLTDVGRKNILGGDFEHF